MSRVTYRGLTSKRLYRFNFGTPNSMPSAGLSNGSLVEIFNYNSENVVLVNNDGSIRRGDAAAPPASDPFGIGSSPSTWESN